MRSESSTGNAATRQDQDPSKRRTSTGTRRAAQDGTISSGDISLMTRAELDPNSFLKTETHEGTFSSSPQQVQIYSSTILEDQMTDRGRDFFTLREDKFFASHKDVSTDPFHTAVIIKNLPPQERTKTLITLRSLRNILGVKSLNDVESLLEDKTAQNEASQKALRLLGNEYGIKGSEDDIRRVVRGYSETANEVIDTIRRDELSDFGSGLEMINDVASTHDPVELLLMTFDNSYDSLIRFEAKRKIVLMMLAANIDLRGNEIDVTSKQNKLDEFLTEFVFTKSERRGQVDSVYYLSKFDPKNYACTSVKVLKSDQVNLARKIYIDPETKEEKNLGEHEKLIGATRRSFTYQGKEIPIRIKNPPKEAVRKILKLIRKGVGNPAVAVDDDVRMMGVVDTLEDVYRFIAHLQDSAIRAGTYIDFEAIEDTLTGGEREETSITSAVKYGGSSEVQMLKFNARFGLPGEKPVYMEGMMHTNQTYMDYEYLRGVAHREYAARRFFGDDDELATADLLFPKIHYGIEIKLGREQRLERIRYELEREAAGIKQPT